MKQKIMSCITFFSFFAASLFATNAFAHKLTKEQKDELYRNGMISVFDENGKKTGHFVVEFLPGADRVSDGAKEQWKGAAKLMGDLTQRKSFWEGEFLKSFTDGMSCAKKSITETGVGAIGDDFRKTRESNREIGNDFGSAAYKTKNWALFGLKAVYRTMRTVIGVGAGTVYSVVAPTAAVVYRPLAAATKSIVKGTLWPAIQYTWNGTAWVLTQDNHMPSKDSLTVTFVPENVEE